MLGMEMPGMGDDDDVAGGRGGLGAPVGQPLPQSPLGIPGVGGAILKGLGGRLPGL
jgi:hypothetical protein